MGRAPIPLPRGTPAARLRRPAMLLAGCGCSGSSRSAPCIVFENRVDETRRAQVVIAQMHNQQGALLAVAFNPAVAGSAVAPSRQQTARQLAAGEARLQRVVAKLAGSGSSDAPARIARRERTLLPRSSTASRVLVGATRLGAGRAALLGKSRAARRASERRLRAEFNRADAGYGADAARSRTVALDRHGRSRSCSCCSAFSIAFHYSVRARRRSHADATTDALTGLGNRRKLFADMERAVASLAGEETLHARDLRPRRLQGLQRHVRPSGRRRAARAPRRPARRGGRRQRQARTASAATSSSSSTAATTASACSSAAQAALSEQGAGLLDRLLARLARASAPGITLEQALHVADQRLYANKRSRRAARSDARPRTRCCRCSPSRTTSLVTHLEHVAAARASDRDRPRPPARAGRARRGSPPSCTTSARPRSRPRSSTSPARSTPPSGVHGAPQRDRRAHRRRRADARGDRADRPRRPRAADGNGYPDGLALDEIPICARIIAVVDAFDAMTSDRPYRDAMPRRAARSPSCAAHAGTQFDPAVVEAFAGDDDRRLVVPARGLT